MKMGSDNTNKGQSERQGRSHSAHPNAQLRRDEIVQAAAKLFDEVGYHGTPMEAIADAVGIRKPTLYHYVQSKEDILALIHEAFIDILLDRQRARRERRISCSNLLLETFVDIFEMIHDHHGYVTAFFEHYRELGADAQNSVREKRDAYFDATVEVLKEGRKNGEFDIRDPELTALAFFGMCNFAYTWYRPGTGLQPRDLAYHFWEIFNLGVAPRPVTTSTRQAEVTEG